MTAYRRNYSARYFKERGGKDFPRVYTSDEVAQGQARVLQQRYGREKQPAVALSEDSGTLERTARNHLSGANCMDLKTFFNACQRIPELKAWGARMMGLATNLDPSFEAELQGLIQAYYAICDQSEAGADGNR